ncbi:hypothetical protein QE381_002520 [Microbacterium sp. SORGH_AS 888]|nr:hypothetical protein [Microbacterium sp. SORGH_AS_0888]
MRRNYEQDSLRLDRVLADYESRHGALPGLAQPGHREALIEQLIDSEQRVRYTDRLRGRALDPKAGDPRDPGFDPIRAAILNARAGDLDEAIWLVYLFVHFGKHRHAGWRYIRYVYGAFGEGPSGWWTWARTAADPFAFRLWLAEHQDDFHRDEGRHGFGNHRKYESLDAWKDAGTGAAIASYVTWVLAAGGDHAERFASFSGGTPEESFDSAYRSLDAVIRFGRTARFDYLTMLGKLGLVELLPPHSYVVNATGPRRGAALLLRGDPTDGTGRELQAELAQFGNLTGIRPDVLEDAICNWQKQPDKYVKFSG